MKANRLRALAVTSDKRSAFVLGLPTVAEAGVSGFGSEQADAEVEQQVKRLDLEPY